MRRLRAAHAAVATAFVPAVPLVVYLVNGTFEPFAVVLGAVMGFCFWYFLDPLP